jgi:tetratricopeptide (TPR) repeat protein
VSDPLRRFWDFEALDATEVRFRELLAGEDSPVRRAEILTQLARIEGLRGRFAKGHTLVEEAAALGGPRVDLERGRLLRSAGDSGAALPLFESAFAAALEAGEEFVAADAAHMAALAAPDREAMSDWTRRGLEVAHASDDPYWAGPLLNNLGWAHHEAGEHEQALGAFEAALAARERDPERPYEIEIARYAVAKALLALGRPAEAAEGLERCVAWATGAGKRDRWFHDALAEAYTALGRVDDAGEQARLAELATP